MGSDLEFALGYSHPVWSHGSLHGALEVPEVRLDVGVLEEVVRQVAAPGGELVVSAHAMPSPLGELEASAKLGFLLLLFGPAIALTFIALGFLLYLAPIRRGAS